MQKQNPEFTFSENELAEHVDGGRDRVRGHYEDRVARLGDELDHLIKLLSHARECLENELFGGLGYKKLGISDKDLRKLQSLGASMNSAVQAKIRYDQVQKSMADAMSPEEEFESVISYVRTLDRERFNQLREKMSYYSEKMRAADEVAKRGREDGEAHD